MTPVECGRGTAVREEGGGRGATVVAAAAAVFAIVAGGIFQILRICLRFA